MTVQVREAAEPSAELVGDWSGRGTGSPSLLASSHALQRLQREIERYVLREIGGRSILVSGHRGAGKTTLVLQAVAEVARRLGPRPLRPLLIRVQGPDLVSAAEAPSAPPSKPAAASGEPARKQEGGAAPGGEPAASSEGSAASGEGVTKPKPAEGAANGSAEPAAGASVSSSVVERALKQLTLAICRAAVERFSVAVRARCDPPPSTTSTSSGSSTDPAAAAAPRGNDELAAGFRLLLDDGPEPAALREVYRRLGVLDRGVLFDPLVVKAPADQAWRELVALASLAQAFRLISGRQAKTTKDTDALTRKRELEGIGLDPKVAQALASVVAGGLVGGGAAFAGGKPLAAALAAIGTALATTLGLGVASSWTRTRGSSRDYSFIRDYDASTLERELPVLLDRLHDAGLAPVFMVDELDKLPEVERDMRTLINRLKHLVSERALFCFLTDREYYERLLASARSEAYPLEHTYFSERLFAIFRPQELHDYLDAVLEASDPRDATDKEALRYLLLHRSRMHMADLRAELAALRAQLAPRGTSPPSAVLGLGTGEITTKFGYRHAIGLQLTVELLLSRDDLLQRLDQDPQFGQLAYDALYYVSRKWQEGKPLDVSKAAFDEYLGERMNPNRRDGDAQAAEMPLRPIDRELLHQLVLDLVQLLLDPETLRSKLETLGIAEVLPQRLIDRLIEPVAGEPERYDWRFDSFGRRLIAEPPAAPPAPAVGVEGAEAPPEDLARSATFQAGSVTTAERPLAVSPPPSAPVTAEAFATFVKEVRADRDYILAMDRAVRKHTEVHSLATLAERLSILSTAPAWTQVTQALERFGAAADSGVPYGNFDEDRRTIGEYRAMLGGRAQIVAACIHYAQQIAFLEPNASFPARDNSPHPLWVSSALDVLAAALRLRSASTQPRMWSVVTAYGKTASRELVLQARGEGGSAVVPSLEFAKPPIDAEDPARAEQRSWSEWDERLREWLLTGQTEFAATEAYLRARLTARPSALLDLDLKSATIGVWSQIAHASLEGPADVPSWALLPATMRLNLLSSGSLDLARRWFERIRQPSLPTASAAQTVAPEAALRWLTLSERRLTDRGAPIATAVIVVPGDPKALSAGAWLPSERFGAIAMPAVALGPEKMTAEARFLIQLARLAATTTFMVLCDGEEAATIGSQSFAQLALGGQPDNRVPMFVFSSDPAKLVNVDRIHGLPFLPATSNDLDATMEQALATRQR